MKEGRYFKKAVIVSGAGSGMGRAIALRLAREGAKVGIIDLDKDQGQETKQLIVGEGGAAVFSHCDVTSEDDVHGSVGEVIRTLGSPHLVVNGAFKARFSHFSEQRLDEWNQIININVTGTFLVSRSVLPNLLGTGGSIVNIVGASGLIGQAYAGALGASSAAVIQLTKSMAYEYQDRGVRINAIAIGGVDPSRLAHLGFPSGSAPRHMERMLSPLGVPSPTEIGDVVAFLGSKEARCITGIVLPVDGGISA